MVTVEWNKQLIMFLKWQSMNEIIKSISKLIFTFHFRYFTDKLKQHPGFELVLPSFQSNNICFWYIPTSIRNGEKPKELISKVAPAIKKKMMECGTLMIGYQPLTTKNLPNFFRFVLSCFPKPTKEDLDFVVSEIERLGESIEF